MDALLMRFEEPSSMARWDSPLYTVGYDDPEPPYDDLWLAVTSAIKKKANPSVVPVSQRPHSPPMPCALDLRPCSLR